MLASSLAETAAWSSVALGVSLENAMDGFLENARVLFGLLLNLVFQLLGDRDVYLGKVGMD